MLYLGLIVALDCWCAALNVGVLRWLASTALILKTRWHCVHVLCDGFDVSFCIGFGAGIALSAAGICWLSLVLGCVQVSLSVAHDAECCLHEAVVVGGVACHAKRLFVVQLAVVDAKSNGVFCTNTIGNAQGPSHFSINSSSCMRAISLSMISRCLNGVRYGMHLIGGWSPVLMECATSDVSPRSLSLRLMMLWRREAT